VSAATVRNLAAWARQTQTRVVFHPYGGVSRQNAASDDHYAMSIEALERLIETGLPNQEQTDQPAQQDRSPHTEPVATSVPGYLSLSRVLIRAYEQAAKGKGAERHAQGRRFEEQPMQDLCDLYGVGFALGQAGKKAQESQRLPRDRAVAELLGAIVYLAGAIVHMERSEGPANG
jgi:hypothetical protein